MMLFKKNTGYKSTLESLLHGTVSASMASVETALSTSKIRKSALFINELVSTTASASEEMVSTVSGIADHASEASHTAESVNAEVQGVVETMNITNQKMNETGTRMQMLKGASDKIQDVVTAINGITDQTNLLALNASIEAARAGEAGKGFAVVADEVRKLATESQKATAEISEMIKEIQQEVNGLSDAVTFSQKSVEEGTEKVSCLSTSAQNIRVLMENIAHSTKEQSEASGQISESILSISEEAHKNEEQTASIMTLIDDLTQTIEDQRSLLSEQDIPQKILVLAQADHVLWKKKIVDFEMGRIDLDPNNIGDHFTCRLGVWYYGDGAKYYKNNPDYKQMEAPHIVVHDMAKKAIEERHRNKNADISDYIEKLEEASVIVVRHLKNLLK